MRTFPLFPSRPDRRAQRLRAVLGLVASGLPCLMGVPAQAWNATGHMAVAGIAYDNLTPRARAAVDALLLRHKDYGRWMADLPGGATAPGDARARYAFERAATWPDDVRQTPDDRPIWHYVDVPVVAPGYTPDPIALLQVRPNAETQVPVEAALLADAKAADGDRAVALCWVEHLVGDIHQPLHDASLFSAQFPRGDRGGNSELLTEAAVSADPVEAAAHPHNLHALWDDILGTTRDPADVQKIVVRLEGPVFARKTYPQIGKARSVHAWVTEGNIVARDVAYVGGKMASVRDGTRADLTLPAGYLTVAHAVGDRQAALAGLRLADLINATRFPAVSAAPTSLTLPAAPAPAATQGQVVGNTRTHAYHLPGDAGRLPAEQNRIYFPTEAAAVKAGYHKSGAPG